MAWAKDGMSMSMFALLSTSNISASMFLQVKLAVESLSQARTPRNSVHKTTVEVLFLNTTQTIHLPPSAPSTRGLLGKASIDVS
jgi:hypothetical protein